MLLDFGDLDHNCKMTPVLGNLNFDQNRFLYAIS